MPVIRIGRSGDGVEVRATECGPTVTLCSLPRWVLDRMAALDMCEKHVYVPGLGVRGFMYDTDPDRERGIRIRRVGIMYSLAATEDEAEEIKRYVKEEKR